MSEDKNSGFSEWFDPDVHDLYNFPEEAMEEAWNAATEKAEAEYEKIVQEKLRQQREACAIIAWQHVTSNEPMKTTADIVPLRDAILNAKIDD